jgi:hypothetical protein
MPTLLVPPLIGLSVALLRTRSLTALANEPIRWWPIAVLAFGFDLLLARIPVTAIEGLAEYGHWLWVGTLVAVAAMLARNAINRTHWQRAPWLLALLGTALNLVVIFANGGYMPVDGDLSAAAEQRQRYRRDVPITEQTRLPWLADVITDPGWFSRSSLISMGDLFLVGGLTLWLVSKRRTTDSA